MIALALVLLLQAAPAKPWLTEDEQTPYVRCLFEHAKMLDDGTSDASSVGGAVAESCHAQFYDMAKLFVSRVSGSPEVRAETMRTIEATGKDRATEVVLMRRAKEKRSVVK